MGLQLFALSTAVNNSKPSASLFLVVSAEPCTTTPTVFPFILPVCCVAGLQGGQTIRLSPVIRLPATQSICLGTTRSAHRHECGSPSVRSIHHVSEEVCAPPHETCFMKTFCASTSSNKWLLILMITCLSFHLPLVVSCVQEHMSTSLVALLPLCTRHYFSSPCFKNSAHRFTELLLISFILHGFTQLVREVACWLLSSTGWRSPVLLTLSSSNFASVPSSCPFFGRSHRSRSLPFFDVSSRIWAPNLVERMAASSTDSCLHHFPPPKSGSQASHV